MLKRITAFVVVCLLSPLVFANPFSPTSPPSDPSPSLESLINRYMTAFHLTPDNRFKLAAYAEMKGRYMSDTRGLNLAFGSLGEVSFFPKNLLFRTGDQRVFHLNTGEVSQEHSSRINEQLRELFDRVILLGNHDAQEAHIGFVDEHLAKKNLEPFAKLFMRHILIKYGKYDSSKNEVVFHTDWLPEKTYNYRNPKDASIVKKHITPLAIKLSETILRGYYLNTGGTVFIEDVPRAVLFATGEEYDPHIHAFKLFAQKLFVQTVQYISRMESQRLDALSNAGEVITNPMASTASSKKSVLRPQSSTTSSIIKPLYHPDSWIPMMLSILRSKDIHISDAEIISCFVNQEYFPKLYKQLTIEEKEKVDQFIADQEK
ncbi:MAG: hypothetical protein AAF587_27260 [Bacteroidota bacterium]